MSKTATMGDYEPTIKARATLVSKILYLDENYQPCGTRIVRRPDATHHNSRVDNDRVMSAGIKAFDEHEFENRPKYWVPYEGDIKDFRDFHLRDSAHSIESMLSTHFRFVSLHEIDRKIGRIMEILGFNEAHRYEEFKVCTNGWIKPHQTVVSLCDGDEDGKKFSIGDFLCSLRDGIAECSEAIEVNRKLIAERDADMRFISNAMDSFRANRFSNSVRIGEDSYMYYDKFCKLILNPAFNNTSKIIHDLKQRMKELERQRSYMYHILSIIMSSTWYAE